MCHFCITYLEFESMCIKLKKNEKYKIILSRRSYLFEERYFSVRHYGLIFFQRRIRKFLLKRKYFKKLLQHKLVNELKSFFYSPGINISNKSIFQMGGPMYREIKKEY